MEKNLSHAAAPTAATKSFWQKHRKNIIIVTSVIVLQLIFGFDPKFCIINIVWLFV